MESNSELIREIELLEDELTKRVASEKSQAESWRSEQLSNLSADLEQYKRELEEQKERELQASIRAFRQEIEESQPEGKVDPTQLAALTDEEISAVIARNIHLILPEIES